MSRMRFMLERQWSAELVRSARRALARQDFDRAGELLDWTMLISPKRPAIERMRVRVLLAEQQQEAAAAMIERRLLDRPRDPLFLLLRARCNAQRGEWRQASEDLMRLRMVSPERRDALELAAHVAGQLGDHECALESLLRLHSRVPHDERIVMLLCNALIETGDSENARYAERLLKKAATPPPPTLMARAFTAQGRHREALELLDLHVAGVDLSHPDAEIDAMVAQYAAALETCGEVRRLERLMAQVTPGALPTAALRLATIALAQGRFRFAAARALRVLRHERGSIRAAALPIAYVASTLAGRLKLARAATRRCSGSGGSAMNTPEWVKAWQRGFRGRILHEQRLPRGATHGGSDPSPSILRPLLRRAEAALHQRYVEMKSGKVPGSAGLSQLEHDLATCRGALGVLS